MSVTPIQRPFPTIRLANAASRLPPLPGPPRNTVGLESIASGLGRLTDKPWLDSSEPGNLYCAGEILYGKLRPYLAKIWLADRSGNYIGDFIRMLPANNFRPHFLKYTLLASQFTQAATVAATGTKMPRTEWASLKDLTIPCPPVDLQETIATYLDHETAEIDRFITDTSRLQHLVEERVLATTDVSIWSMAPAVVPIRRVLRYIDQGISPSVEAMPAEPGELGLLKSGCTNTGRFNIEANKRVPNEISIPPDNFISPGDVIMSRASGSERHVGSVALVPELDRTLALSDKNYRLHFEDAVDSLFMVAAMNTRRFRDNLQPLISGAPGLAKNISVASLKSISIPFHDILKQRQLGHQWNKNRAASDALNKDLSRAVELARERRAALITAAVTGQIDVTARNKPAAEQLEDDIAQGLHREN